LAQINSKSAEHRHLGRGRYDTSAAVDWAPQWLNSMHALAWHKGLCPTLEGPIRPGKSPSKFISWATLPRNAGVVVETLKAVHSIEN